MTFEALPPLSQPRAVRSRIQILIKRAEKKEINRVSQNDSSGFKTLCIERYTTYKAGGYMLRYIPSPSLKAWLACSLDGRRLSQQRTAASLDKARWSG
ncbi:hypothetical protein AVEN_45933-1 [Araneus ventricosus]|uniref:Uncharacterized protein n=1 Tax=Araneus ventricosus TaxID=182803 RepID=A0A4Y2EBB7_ARAVE|nr:hypothetical protein AVEN_45933-1 [Araneus ventricosus]